MRDDPKLARQIELSAQRIAAHQARLASLANQPDGRMARELTAKLLDSEERFHANLQASLAQSLQRRPRPRGIAVTPRWLAFALAVLIASIAIAHFTRHPPATTTTRAP